MNRFFATVSPPRRMRTLSREPFGALPRTTRRLPSSLFASRAEKRRRLALPFPPCLPPSPAGRAAILGGSGNDGSVELSIVSSDSSIGVFAR